MAIAVLVLGIGGVGCNIMSCKVARQTSHISFLGLDTSEPMACTTEVVPNAIQSKREGLAVAWARLEECARRYGNIVRNGKYRVRTDYIQTLERRIQNACRRRADDAYDRMVQQLRNKMILPFDLGTATSDLTNNRREWNCNRFLDLTIHQNRHSPENKSRYLQLRGKMTQMLDAYEKFLRIQSGSVRKSFDYSTAISGVGNQSWVTTGSWPEILDSASTKQYDSNGFLCGMQNALTATNQSISELLRSLLIRLIQRQTEIPGTNYLHQHDTMPLNERICTTADPINLRICDLLRQPITGNHMPKRFVFFPKPRMTEGSRPIPVMSAA